MDITSVIDYGIAVAQAFVGLMFLAAMISGTGITKLSHMGRYKPIWVMEPRRLSLGAWALTLAYFGMLHGLGLHNAAISFAVVFAIVRLCVHLEVSFFHLRSLTYFTPAAFHAKFGTLK